MRLRVSSEIYCPLQDTKQVLVTQKISPALCGVSESVNHTEYFLSYTRSWKTIEVMLVVAFESDTSLA